MKQSLRTLTFGLLCLFGPFVYGWITLAEMTFLNWFLAGAVILWAFLFGLWYLIFGKAPWKRRCLNFGAAAGGFFLVALLLSSLLRYEGSASGSSFPKFSWVWQEKDSAMAEPGGDLFQTGLTLEEERLNAAAGPARDFLGPDRNGMWSELPFDPDWTAQPPELLWRRPLGRAWSGFAVSHRRAITQEQAGDAERILCLDLFSGEERWHYDNPNTRLLLVKEENQGAAMGGDGPRSTPVIRGDRVYALGSTGILNCLHLNTGAEVWSRNVIADYGGEVQKWGSANAPLIVPGERILVVPGSDSPGATLIAFDLETGEEKWVYRGNGASYSSPRLMQIGGVRLIVSVNQKDVTGHDPATGEELWKYSWPGNFPKVGQPILVGTNQLLLTASYGVGSPLIELNRDTDGKWTVTEQWKSTRLKTKFSSALVIGDYAYGIDEGRLAAIDLARGQKVWKDQKVGFGQQLLFGTHLLIQTESGDVITGPIGPEGFTEISRLPALSSMTWNVPTVAGRILLVRNDREAACFLLPAPK